MLAEPNEIVAEPDLEDDRWHLADESGQGMIAETHRADGGHRREHDVWRIRYGPADGHVLDRRIVFQLVPHLAAGNDLPGLVAQDCPHDDEATLYADDLTDPGNDDAWDEAEDDTVHRQEWYGWQARHITQDNHEDTDDDGAVAEGRKILCQAVDITIQRQPEQRRIEIGNIEMDP